MSVGWNHNSHYWPVVLAAVPTGPIDVLDVGCGYGELARALAARGARVVAIDVDEPTLEAAREEGGGVDYRLGDFASLDFADQRFDAVVSVAALHHIDAAHALQRMRDLVRPGGVVAVIGLAAGGRPLDLPWEAAAALAHRWHVARRGYAEQTAPTLWPPPLTHKQMRRVAQQVLPGARFRRRLLWRYTIVWRKQVS